MKKHSDLQLDLFALEPLMSGQRKGRADSDRTAPSSLPFSPGTGGSPHMPAQPLFAKPVAPPKGVPPPTVPGNKRQVLLSGEVLEYALRRSQRRSIGFLINDEGLRVTAPKWVSLADIDLAIQEKQRWILTKLRERGERKAQPKPTVEWNDGALLPYLGGEISLRLTAGSANRVRFDQAVRELNVCLVHNSTQQQLKDRVQAWYKAEAKRVFGLRLPLYAQKLGVTYQTFALSSAGTRWGSCTSRGKIRLNWRLMHFGLELIDYVVAHELSHLREMNHSPRFWAIVGSIYPDFETARKTLRQRAQEMPTVF